MAEKENIFNLEQALKAFWKDYGQGVSINARHTYVTVEPKFIIGNKVNQEVARKLIGVYLSQLSSDKIVSGEIMITKEGLKIFDSGELIMEISDQKIIDSLSNKVTHDLGTELSKRQKKTGGTYVEGKESYTFGDIKNALSEFLLDSEKHDSKNMLKDAILLLMD